MATVRYRRYFYKANKQVMVGIVNTARMAIVVEKEPNFLRWSDLDWQEITFEENIND